MSLSSHAGKSPSSQQRQILMKTVLEESLHKIVRHSEASREWRCDHVCMAFPEPAVAKLGPSNGVTTQDPPSEPCVDSLQKVARILSQEGRCVG
jgi:hypothetical protein